LRVWKHLGYAAAWLQLIAWVAGCSTLPNGRGWGEDATPAPGWTRVGQAAVQAARDPWVWIPLVGAAVFQIDGWDRRVSDWARRDTPVFGSQAHAERWSDTLRSASAVAEGATVLFTPSGDVATDWILYKAKGLAVDLAAATAAIETTSGLQRLTDRTRPNGTNDTSLPSGHTTASAAYTQLASRNLDSIDLDPSVRRSLDFGLGALTVGTAWARVEAGEHFPADTLVGMAIGNFFGHWFDAAFLGLSEQSQTTVAIAPLHNRLALHWEARF
jgi:membrane-associated phospholipid phosphatase